MNNKRSHWEGVYQRKKSDEVSWFQSNPQTSLDLVRFLNIKKTDSIIDIGGGDSRFAESLLDLGFSNISVLDISESAIQRARERLDERAGEITWIVSDVLDFKPETAFDLWHDRAAFHFLTDPVQVERYIELARSSVKDNGFMTIGTFSENGPEKCSGLEVSRYSEARLTTLVKNGFNKIKCFLEDHLTPFNTVQNFLFCSFKRS